MLFGQLFHTAIKTADLHASVRFYTEVLGMVVADRPPIGFPGAWLKPAQAGADAIFLTRPFDSQSGVMQPDGTPGELFLPWRVTAAAITGSEYIGQMQLPGGSTNHVFARSGQAVMIVWNDKPTRELVGMAREKVVVLTLDRDIAEAPQHPAFAKSAKTGERTVEITYDRDRMNAGEVLAVLQGQGYGIADVVTREPDLEDVFLTLTSAPKEAA